MTEKREVVLDARWLRTGIGRYILTLLQKLKPQLSPASLTCITLPEHVKAIEPYCDRVVPFSSSIYTVKEQLALPMLARNASVFCSPHYNIPILRSGPLVVTVHDLTHLIFPAYKAGVRSMLYSAPMLRMACGRSSRVVTPSRYTKQMLISHLNADASKISVIPCAVDDVFQPQDKISAGEKVRLSHGICGPYILCVTSAAPHKNLTRLLTVHRQLCSQYKDMPTLVLVLPEDITSPRIDEHMRSLMTSPRVRCLSAVPDVSLASLYAAALMTILPSHEEGFGLPVIESMACGTPVACSHTGALPEIAGDAAVFFAPDSEEQMSSAMLQILHSYQLRQRLAAYGLEHAAIYSASHAAQTYAAMLASVLNEQN